MGVRGLPDDDRPTVDLGPRAPSEGLDATESLDDPADDPAGGDVLPTRTIVGPDVHVLPTQQLEHRPPRAGVGSPSASLRSHSATVAASPVEAMRLDERERTRVFLKLSLAICLGGVIVALTSSGDPVARNALLIGTTGAFLGAVWLLYALRDPTRYEPRMFLIPGPLIVFGSMTGVYYWGHASPVAAMLVYGIYFFSLGANRLVVTGMYVLVAVLHGALGLAIIGGVIEDRGIVHIGGAGTTDQVSVLAIIEVLYFVAFYTARASQKVTLDAMTKLEHAARTVAQRDALLAEARAELDRALKIGGPGRYSEQVVGKFKLGMLIGRGGMGEVYEAHAVADGGEAAVKLLHPSTLTEPTHVARFLREADTAARLACPNVVRVLEVGTTEGQIPFLAMERLRGHDLAHVLRRHRKIGLAQARTFASQVAIGLDAARQAGIVHRDLKPHNVFHAEDGAGARVWKILDFGVSKVGGSGTLTKGHVVGTPAYMAPEQARGEDVDHRADVYSLAAILYRSVTGHPAFTGKDVPTTLYDVVYRVPTQPSMLSGVPADIDRVLAIGLAKLPADRFSTALELADWFAAACEGALDLDQRRRGDEVIARYAWGTRLGLSTIS